MFRAKFTGNKKVEVEANGFKINTDLPAAMGGDNSAPNPFDTFLAAFTACTATYVLLYLDKQGLSKEGVSVEMEVLYNEKRDVENTVAHVIVPASFPVEKEAPLLAMAKHCHVGNHLNFPHDVVIVR